MTAAQLGADPELRVVGREALFAGEYFFMGNWARTVYDYDRQNDRFLMVTFGGDGFPREITVVQNWFQELTERVPVP